MEQRMQTGIEFLKDQIDHAVAQHRTLVQSMAEHESDADDQRYRDLCTRHIPHMRLHQSMLEEFRASLGEQPAQTGSSELAGIGRQAAGTDFPAARSCAHAPHSHYTPCAA